MGRFEHLSDETIHRGYVIDLVKSSFRAPDGSTIERDVVRHPGAVSVVPLLETEEVVLVSQFRAPLQRTLIEIPAGKRDVAGEEPALTAQRELAEEVGLQANSLTKLLVFHNSVGFSDEESHVYLGQDLSEVPSDRQGVEEENMEILRVPLDEAISMVYSGEITDGKTVIGLLATSAHIGAR